MSRKAKKDHADQPDGKPEGWVERTYAVQADGSLELLPPTPPDPMAEARRRRRWALEIKVAEARARGPRTARLVHRKAEERHKRIGDFAVAWVREFSSNPRIYAEPRHSTRLAGRLLPVWPKKGLGKPPALGWLRRILSKQHVCERIRDSLEN